MSRHDKVFTYERIPFRELLFDPENARMDPAEGQIEALMKMLEDQKLQSGNKIFELAKDIAREGLKGDAFVVFKTDQGESITLDGNRRLTALKLLDNPDLGSGFEGGSLTKKFRRFLKNFAKEEPDLYAEMLPNEVDCITYTVEYLPQAQQLVFARHANEGNGEGQSKWGGLAKQRYEAKLAGSAKGDELKTLNFLLEGESNDEKIVRIKSLYTEAKGTTITRIIKSKAFKDTLGFSLSKDGVTSEFNGADTIRPILLFLVEYFNTAKPDGNSRTVDDVQGQELLGKFVEEFWSAVQNKFPNYYPTGKPKQENAENQSQQQSQNEGSSSGESNSGDSGNESQGASEGQEKDDSNNEGGAQSGNDSEATRNEQGHNYGTPNGKPRTKLLIDKWQVGLPRDHKILKCVEEMKSIDINKYPLAACFLSRALLELSRVHFEKTYPELIQSYKTQNADYKTGKKMDIGKMIVLLAKIDSSNLSNASRGENIQTMETFTHDTDFGGLIDEHYTFINRSLHTLGYTISVSKLLQFWQTAEPILVESFKKTHLLSKTEKAKKK